jgi:hypothetical protein
MISPPSSLAKWCAFMTVLPRSSVQMFLLPRTSTEAERGTVGGLRRKPRLDFVGVTGLEDFCQFEDFFQGLEISCC